MKKSILKSDYYIYYIIPVLQDIVFFVNVTLYFPQNQLKILKVLYETLFQMVTHWQKCSRQFDIKVQTPWFGPNRVVTDMNEGNAEY